MRPRPGQHDHLDGVVGRRPVKRVIERVSHLRILRIPVFRPVHGDARSRTVTFIKDDVRQRFLLSESGAKRQNPTKVPAPTPAWRTGAGRIRSYSPSPRGTGSRSVPPAAPHQTRVLSPPRSAARRRPRPPTAPTPPRAPSAARTRPRPACPPARA